MKKYFDIKFTITVAIGIGAILSLYGAFAGNNEAMYTGAGILTARTGFNKFGKRK